MQLKFKPLYLLVLLSLPLILLISCSSTEEVTTTSDSTCYASDSRCDTPVSVTGISNSTAISGGRDHMCSLISGGTAKCWGDNYQGQLGNGSTTDSSSPVSVSNISTATGINAGENHTCAVLSDKTVKCWGDNVIGQLGNGSWIPRSTAEPYQEPGDRRCGRSEAGEAHWNHILRVGYGHIPSLPVHRWDPA